MAFAGIFQPFVRLRWIRFGLLMRDGKFSRRFSVPQTTALAPFSSPTGRLLQSRLRFKSASHPGGALTVREVGALSDLDDVTVRIADVAARLPVLGDRLRDELGSSAFPQFVARLDIGDADIHKAVDVIRVGDSEGYSRLIRRRPAPDVDQEPRIRDLNVRRCARAVASALDATFEDGFIEASRSVDIGDGEKMCDA